MLENLECDSIIANTTLHLVNDSKMPILTEFKELVVSLNKTAMNYLSRNLINEARQTLLHAEEKIRLAKDVVRKVTNN